MTRTLGSGVIRDYRTVKSLYSPFRGEFDPLVFGTDTYGLLSTHPCPQSDVPPDSKFWFKDPLLASYLRKENNAKTPESTPICFS